MTGQNGECQMVLDNRGNPLNDLSGPALPLGIAVTGEVSNGGYEYYTVRKRYVPHALKMHVYKKCPHVFLL